MTKLVNTFSSDDADGWYERNFAKRKDFSELISRDPVRTFWKNCDLPAPLKILEVGCSNGWRLQGFHTAYSSICMGVDPSPKAIADGSKLFKDLKLTEGYADNLNFSDGMFDLVILGFCLYLCPRENLFQVAAEVDRVLAEKGRVVLYDFSSPLAYKKKYAPRPELHSFKMEYEKMFLWNPAYTLVGKELRHHENGSKVDIPLDDQVSVVVLQKDNLSAYPLKGG